MDKLPANEHKLYKTVDRTRSVLVLTLLTLTPVLAQAIPAFNRQTGQNCVACHAGGQFPELTPREFAVRAWPAATAAERPRQGSIGLPVQCASLSVP
jgi:hypothetical protein